MILHGNNIEILGSYSDNYFDSVVTDPPYGISFMGKKWDYQIPSVELWQEVLRVLKPGGHALIACGTRTQHRMAVNIEDAGFEIRDVITWHYGSGFPKSLDISKAIDKQAGVEREVIGKRTDGRYAYRFQDGNNQFVNAENNLRKEVDSKIGIITEPCTPAAKQYNGFGTALKPATEFWTLARKPLSENTVAENVLKYGTGGINVDGCRINTTDTLGRGNVKGVGSITDANVTHEARPETSAWKGNIYDSNVNDTKGGRFPANLIFSCDCEGAHEQGCPVGELDRQSGVLKTNPGIYYKDHPITSMGDSGGASRFFYVAKSSKAERGKNNIHPTVKPVTLMRYLCRLITPPKGIILDPFNGSGSTGVAAALEWFEYVGIEQEESHVEVSKARQPPKDLFS